MRRHLVWCIWILAALLVAASVDAIPDPPALDPHFAAMKVPSPSGLAVHNPPGDSSSLPPFQARECVLVGDSEPHFPAEVLAQMEQAADPSPPLFI
jgi:hypothetical protein